MKTSKRYEIELSPSWEVGIRCVHVEVHTKTRIWSNGPIITDAEDFCVLTPEAKRAVTRIGRAYDDIDSLLEASEEEEMHRVDPMDVRLVRANCKVHRRYLYVSETDDFMSETDIVAYAKAGEM